MRVLKRYLPFHFEFGGVAWRDLLWQACCFGMAAAIMLLMLHDVNHHLAERGVNSGFGFLWETAKIPITNAPIQFTPGVNTYGFALWVGALNTLKISVAVIVLATVIGAIVGITSLSPNWLLSKLSVTYVELLRNVPVLLQILLWYQVINGLPSARQALNPLPGVYLSNRGINFPLPASNLAYAPIVATLVITMVCAMFAWCIGSRWYGKRGEHKHWLMAIIAIFVMAPIAVLVASNPPHAIDVPKLQGFNFSGGGVLTPEYAALVIGLTLYTAAFIAEIVRAGIQSIGAGQWQAAQAIGLNPWTTLSTVILPQAMRPIIPPLTNEYLSILKNSSLAVAIGYQELVSVGNTVLSETGQAVSVVALTMGFYIAVSLFVSLLMSIYYNRLNRAHR